MKTNVKTSHKAMTHEGGRADPHQKPLVELTRAVSTCLLFENTFYEQGNDLAQRIADLCLQVTPEEIATLAVKARTDLKLRHVPLWLCVQLLKRKAGKLTGDTIATVVQRPDEMGELIALYRKHKRIPLAAQLKRGLALAFKKFSEYQLSKWDRDATVTLRDVLFMVHAEPKPRAEHDPLPEVVIAPAIEKPHYRRGPVARDTRPQAQAWKQLIDGTLASPDTWEVALSAGKDKKETWTRLLTEKKLGYIALLMNLRNILLAGVEQGLVESALLAGAKDSKALPFRFVSAYKHAPQYAQALSDAMQLAVTGTLLGSTVIVIDVSGSMDAPLSNKGTLTRWEAAAALAVLVRGLAPSCRVFTYSDTLIEIGNLKGLGLIERIGKQVHGGTQTEAAIKLVNQLCPGVDRMILLTDEQAHDGLCTSIAPKAYVINVAPYKPGLELGGSWVRINGFSERVVEWIQLQEQEG